MEVLICNDLDKGKLNDKIQKTVALLQIGDFRAADVKKMTGTGYYRAKLDDTNRLLFSIGSFGGKKYIVILELILNHTYERPRFLKGAAMR